MSYITSYPIQALLKSGKRIKRKIWEDRFVYLVDEQSIKSILGSSGERMFLDTNNALGLAIYSIFDKKVRIYSPTFESLIADDWEQCSNCVQVNLTTSEPTVTWATSKHLSDLEYTRPHVTLDPSVDDNSKLGADNMTTKKDIFELYDSEKKYPIDTKTRELTFIESIEAMLNGCVVTCFKLGSMALFMDNAHNIRICSRTINVPNIVFEIRCMQNHYPLLTIQDYSLLFSSSFRIVKGIHLSNGISKETKDTVMTKVRNNLFLTIDLSLEKDKRLYSNWSSTELSLNSIVQNMFVCSYGSLLAIQKYHDSICEDIQVNKIVDLSKYKDSDIEDTDTEATTDSTLSHDTLMVVFAIFTEKEYEEYMTSSNYFIENYYAMPYTIKQDDIFNISDTLEGISYNSGTTLWQLIN